MFTNPEDCKELLERILGMEISEIRVVQNQKDFKNNLSQKGVRLDIYAKDTKGKSDDEWRGNFMTLEQKIEEERRFARKQALAEGLSEGRIQGEEQKLLNLISKKLEKGKSIARIADECEETEERIQELMKKLK